MRRSIIFFFCLALGLVSVEATNRYILDARLTDQPYFHSADADYKLNLIELAGPHLLVFAGSSQVAEAIDPTLFGQQAINVALSAGGPQIMRPWLLDAVAIEGQVDSVVWGVNPLLDLNDGLNRDHVEDAYTGSLGGRVGWSAATERFLERHTATFENRRSWPYQGIEQFFHGPIAAPSISSDQRGFRSGREQVITNALQDRWTTNMAEFAYSVDLESDIRATVTGLQELDVGVTLVMVPVPERLVHLLHGGWDNYTQQIQRLQSLAAELDVTLITAPRMLHDDDQFADYTHVSNEGARTFSLWLVDQLSRTQ